MTKGTDARICPVWRQTCATAGIAMDEKAAASACKRRAKRFATRYARACCPKKAGAGGAVGSSFHVTKFSRSPAEALAPAQSADQARPAHLPRPISFEHHTQRVLHFGYGSNLYTNLISNVICSVSDSVRKRNDRRPSNLFINIFAI